MLGERRALEGANEERREASLGEEGRNRSLERFRVFQIGGVGGIFDDDEPCMRSGVVSEALALLEREHRVPSAPHEQHRLVDVDPKRAAGRSALEIIHESTLLLDERIDHQSVILRERKARRPRWIRTTCPCAVATTRQTAPTQT